MPTDTPAVPGRARRYVAARFTVPVGSQRSPIRASLIWPIADVLGPALEAETVRNGAAAGGGDATLVLDIAESGMMVPPRRRRRRDRRVSSRAVFYQTADA